ncbi:MAG: phosphoribosylglycinamide formyltransferase [Planctomycetes bacterium]|nr:phosphoribosylglycinamide formyltransferase [Planctomycetota bacterium]
MSVVERPERAPTRSRLAVFVSGGGRSLENLVDLAKTGALDVEVALVVTNKADCFALERARKHAIAAVVIDPEKKLSPAEFGRAAFAACDAARCDLVVFAGFLRLAEIPVRWAGRVLNIHPSLLPAFGGKGFYGDKVHAAVLASGVAETGCTVHYVTNEYDRGPIVLQKKVPVLPGDDVHALAARVFEEEKAALPEAIRTHLAGDRGAAGPRLRV